MKKLFVFIILFYFSFPLFAQICKETKSNEIKGQFINGDYFEGKYNYCRLINPKEDNISQINLNINGTSNSYIYVGGGNPTIETSNLGVISIFDKLGGMESPAKITYLTRIDKNLIKLGEINLDYSQGQVINYSIDNVNNKIDALSATFLEKIKQSFINNTKLSYPDYFLLLLFDSTLVNDISSDWINKFYAKLNLMQHKDLINIYSQNIFFKNTTLCNKDKNEKNAFGCQIKNRKLSLCYNYVNSNLFYRFGTQSKIELELVKVIEDKDKKNSSISFANKDIDYVVDTKPGKEGIKIKRKEIQLYNFQCNPSTVEPMILDSFN
ncbi:hypothetical protein A9G48_10635 [Gilliamella sp. wkB18]|jgi:hypothetical protein|uniref:hypothetical protein n=1 Tax=Gilliamella sp. wkB18 TaxID=3120260 RepID=UPI0004DD27C0|nr:hypothetical protein [Gilliamella apicola]KFA58871.1 hypothetical protein GAPWKB11_0760 [Gilliamella apicola]OCG65576.1 hypothetical protein A9G48_10635 [Gilliamella apicola]